jgi:hypothetical protein
MNKTKIQQAALDYVNDKFTQAGDPIQNEELLKVLSEHNRTEYVQHVMHWLAWHIKDEMDQMKLQPLQYVCDATIHDQIFQHEMLRKKVWSDALSRAGASDQFTSYDGCMTFADKCLEKFDRRFPAPGKEAQS